MIIIVTFFITIMTWFYLFKTVNWKYKDFSSPGLCLPFFGHSYKFCSKTFKADPVNEAWKMYKKYQRGGMMYFKMFSQDVVWVGDFDTLKYIFNHPDGNGRLDANMEMMKKKERKVTCAHFPGVVFSSGETWKQQRRFTLRTLRDFGFGKQGMEELIQGEVAQFLSFLDLEVGTPIDISGRMSLPILNSLWRVTVGESFHYSDPRLLQTESKYFWQV